MSFDNNKWGGEQNPGIRGFTLKQLDSATIGAHETLDKLRKNNEPVCSLLTDEGWVNSIKKNGKPTEVTY